MNNPTGAGLRRNWTIDQVHVIQDQQGEVYLATKSMQDMWHTLDGNIILWAKDLGTPRELAHRANGYAHIVKMYQGRIVPVVNQINELATALGGGND